MNSVYERSHFNFLAWSSTSGWAILFLLGVAYAWGFGLYTLSIRYLTHCCQFDCHPRTRPPAIWAYLFRMKSSAAQLVGSLPSSRDDPVRPVKNPDPHRQE
jgi:hypothetical protein